MKTKLTTLERRALALCLAAIQTGQADIVMEWRTSRSYGLQASILNSQGDVCARTGGCGFDKESQALADCLRFLFPIGSSEYFQVWQTSGAGGYSVRETLGRNGWNLEKTASGKTFDCFRLTRHPAAHLLTRKETA